ncbi:FxsA family protein [Corynebacterium felinum]|uniref:UPF0716 protein FxsA n=1 Tax=Corynebacterium felinum TaxID=131318 RepID=A0ABU2BAH2_9CORY|nr:FxsA family protein [Corynebacterium felinum]MDF5819497.1 FxsA family protein [Corynebacterium felinum]MDR7355629.1 UPF0716 protein FxsA [Corynebacterium felinum]WJY94981.1 phage T7 F exclusion suppressor FxsA [Corynebacterium felinum]
MPLYLAVPYFIIEALAFWAVASWLGVGYALLLLFAFFFGGLILAAIEMRRIAATLSRGTSNPGKAAGDIGLIAAGAVGVAMPGFATSILGLLVIIAPTRAIIRRLLAKKLRTTIEDMGVRSFQATNAYRQRASYGSFSTGTNSQIVINEEEIQQWSTNLDPDDFTDKNNH